MLQTIALPSYDDVAAASARIKGHAVETPLLESPALNERLGGRLLFKPEVLQRTGSFKFRGAYNTISSLSEAERSRGVVAFSSGNHAQGVAAVAAMFGVPAIIVMPADAPAIKTANVKAMGATVVPYDRYREERSEVARPYVDKGMALVPPFDHPRIVAGQGTVGLEIVRQAKALGASLDAVVTPCGGGGLSSGIALALEALAPGTELWGAEPEGFDDTCRSLAAGSRQSADVNARSIQDALLSPSPGEITFAINRRLMTGCAVVSDEEAAEAVRAASRYLKLVVEPGGAAAFAAILAGKVEVRNRTLAIVLSGGNIDLDLFARLLTAA